MTSAVEVKDLRLRYGAKPALDGVSFALAPNRIYGLLGRNGSGKTSLLSVLAAFRRHSSGSVHVFGEPVFENPRVTGKVAFVSSEPATVSADFRVREALREARLLRDGWDDGYARQLLELFEVPEQTKIHALSRGKRSALGAVVGLASRAPLTIFDETYLGMDAPSRQAFYDALLADYMERPRTIILSTHLIDELRTILEEVLIIDAGKLLLQEEVETLRARGLTVTGPREAVDRFVAEAASLSRGPVSTIGERRLGRTKAVMLYGDLGERLRARAREAGLDLEPLELQELFVHLTDRKRGKE